MAIQPYTLGCPSPFQKKGLHVQPAGTYLRAFCQGSWDKLHDRYQEILAYADRNGLSLCGYAYETGINELVTDQIDDYITQIEIPVKPLSLRSCPVHMYPDAGTNT